MGRGTGAVDIAGKLAFSAGSTVLREVSQIPKAIGRGVRVCVWPAVILGVLIGSLGGPAGTWAAEGAAEDTPLLRRIPEVGDALRGLDPFFRDTELNLHLRTYYFYQQPTSGAISQAWAGGGWLEYKSGWLLETFQIGATLFGTGPIFAPAGEGGTNLLKPNQDGFVVPGVAYGALRYQEYATLTGFRQLVDTPYLNPYDSRMVPITFEGVTIGGKLGFVEYFGGYLWTIKQRASDVFQNFADQAGVSGVSRGAALGNLKLTPIRGLTLTLHDSFVPDLFNTAYVEARYTLPVTSDLTLEVSAQYTDQRAVGQDLLGGSAFKQWVTEAGGGRLLLTYQGATLKGAFSLTGPGNSIQTPYGRYPGFIKQILNDFNRANETAWLAGLAYDFRFAGVAGLTAKFEYSQGTAAIDPQTRAPVPNEREIDLGLAYRVQRGPLRGLSFDAQWGFLKYTNSGQLGQQLRLILNYEFNLL